MFFRLASSGIGFPRDIDQGSAVYDPGAKSSLPSAFVNKVVLAYSQAPLFLYCLWLLSLYDGNGGAESLRQGPYDPQG